MYLIGYGQCIVYQLKRQQAISLIAAFIYGRAIDILLQARCMEHCFQLMMSNEVNWCNMILEDADTIAIVNQQSFEYRSVSLIAF